MHVRTVRQDRVSRSTSKLVASLLETAGANRVITMELDATQIQGFFDIARDDISAMSIIGNYFRSLEDSENIVVVSPDHGGVTRARKLAEMLHAPLAIIDKRRPKPNVAEAMNLIGDVLRQDGDPRRRYRRYGRGRRVRYSRCCVTAYRRLLCACSIERSGDRASAGG